MKGRKYAYIGGLLHGDVFCVDASEGLAQAARHPGVNYAIPVLNGKLGIQIQQLFLSTLYDD